jgi:hypothetical protein
MGTARALDAAAKEITSSRDGGGSNWKIGRYQSSWLQQVSGAQAYHQHAAALRWVCLSAFRQATSVALAAFSRWIDHHVLNTCRPAIVGITDHYMYSRCSPEHYEEWRQQLKDYVMTSDANTQHMNGNYSSEKVCLCNPDIGGIAEVAILPGKDWR